MMTDHGSVIHLIDMITRENEDVICALIVDKVEILVDGIGGSAIPLLARAISDRTTLEGLQQPHPTAATVEIPGLADTDMFIQAVGAVLG